MSFLAIWFLVSELARAYATHAHRTQKNGMPLANPLHFAALIEGTETWNNWIQHNHTELVADVSEAYLEHLIDVNVRAAIFV
jgi:hypothetical protein